MLQEVQTLEEKRSYRKRNEKSMDGYNLHVCACVEKVIIW